MNALDEILQKTGRVVLDGALATELERRGADLRDTLWSAKILMEAPEMIRDVHLDYFRAGADCAITASYQATLEGFMRRGLDEAAALALIQKSVTLAREARDTFWRENTDPARTRPFVAASVGPYGAFLADGSEYRGDYGLSEDELVAFHRPRMKALVEAGADMLACETIPSLLEARALVRLLTEFPSTSAWISFSAKDGEHTCHGERIADCATYLNGYPQVSALGINCTAPEHIESLVREILSATQKPILVYPNSGETYDATGKQWHGKSDSLLYGEQAQAWYAAGAHVIGGCCRTTPEHIRAVAAAISLPG